MRTLIVFLLVVSASAAAAAQDLEECSSPDLEVPGTDFETLSMVPTADTLEVADAMIIGTLDVFLDITTGFQGDWSEIGVVSPFGTTVLLHAGTGGENEDFDVLFSDAGDTNTGEPDLYDCDGCAIQPAAPRGLSRFTGESVEGTWTLEMLTFSGGTLNEWCVQVAEGCELAPPTGVTCIESDGLDVELSWELPDDAGYESIEVERDGAVIASLDGDADNVVDSRVPAGVHRYRVYGVGACRSGSGLCTLEKTVECDVDPPVDVSCVVGERWPELEWSSSGAGFDALLIVRDGFQVAELGGDSEMFVDEGAPSGRLRYSVLGVSEDDPCLVASLSCEVLFGEVEVCIAPELDIAGEEGGEFSEPTEATLEFDEDFTVHQLELSIDIETEFLSSCWDVTLMSPTGTAVQVHNNQGGAEDGDSVDLLARYSDLGVPATDDTDFACDCLLKPSGPGRMADFAGENPTGEWTLRMFTFGAGTLNEWCVAAFPEADAVSILRGDASGDGSVTGLGDGLFLLRWQFVDDAPVPGCMAAADANGDGDVTGLGDGLFLLRWQFVDDAPAPPDPGPVECGPDPEAGECETPTC